MAAIHLSYLARQLLVNRLKRGIQRRQLGKMRDRLIQQVITEHRRLIAIVRRQTPPDGHQVLFGTKSYVQLHGKGRKDRLIPLWPRTARILKEWFREIGPRDSAVAFPNVRGEPLSRFAIHLLLRKAARQAAFHSVSLKRKRVSPHVVRHGTAMALLQSGVDIAVIALWLGHENIETTNAYVHADLAMKEKALGRVLPMDTPFRRFRADDRLLAFLESI